MNRTSPVSSSANTASHCASCAGPSADRSRWFNDEVHPHSAQLKSYIQKVFPSVHDVDDVIQESYLRIWKASAVKEIRFAKAFLFTVARRLAIDIVRRDRRAPFIAVKDVNQLFVSDKAADAGRVENYKQERQLLIEAIDSLPARCREAFILCQVEGLPQKEVAARLGIAESTVAVQSSRGLQRCEKFVRGRLRE
jgi:RNA polymerase sigma factor (sigma-70 family)